MVGATSTVCGAYAVSFPAARVPSAHCTPSIVALYTFMLSGSATATAPSTTAAVVRNSIPPVDRTSATPPTAVTAHAPSTERTPTETLVDAEVHGVPTNCAIVGGASAGITLAANGSKATLAPPTNTFVSVTLTFAVALSESAYTPRLDASWPPAPLTSIVGYWPPNNSRIWVSVSGPDASHNTSGISARPPPLRSTYPALTSRPRLTSPIGTMVVERAYCAVPMRVAAVRKTADGPDRVVTSMLPFVATAEHPATASIATAISDPDAYVATAAA